VSATLSLLAYLAARTERIRLGTGVTVLPWHNPVLLAEQIATLDLLSGGRADIGVGKGYRPNEFKGFDIPLEQAAERYEETLDLLVQSWTSTERFSHRGKYWSFNDIIVEPAPVQRPHPPVWVGAGSTPSIQRTAEKNFNLLLDHWAPTDTVMERMSTYQASLAQHGHVYTPGRVGVTRAVQVTQTDAQRDALINARAKLLMSVSGVQSGTSGPGLAIGGSAQGQTSEQAAWDTAARGAVIGRPEEVIGKLKELEAAGVEYVLLADATASTEALREFAHNVMPEFADK
jgi:alkanesulfonate monooxygenase SsuD/methylene tetrahydromethanopterin reductase-like flavin-dependent oxidoreductase (luciferase family)